MGIARQLAEQSPAEIGRSLRLSDAFRSLHSQPCRLDKALLPLRESFETISDFGFVLFGLQFKVENYARSP